MIVTIFSVGVDTISPSLVTHTKKENYSSPWYTTLSTPFANFATTITELLPDIPAKVPLAPGLASSIPFY
jgi:hypothetical protein